MQAEPIQYVPAGPVARDFLLCNEVVSGIMGPIGSGKTSACIWKMIRIAQRQRPAYDGVRYTKFRVIRTTNVDLGETTIPSWHQWFPESLGTWRGGDGKGGPSSHHLKLPVADGTTMDILVEFTGLGDRPVERAMRGWEGTAVWLNEADTLGPEVLDFAIGRVGRYPPASKGGCTWAGVFGDWNAPDEENWVAKDFDLDKKPGYAFFKQPSGLSDKAENLRHLPPNYYKNAQIGKDEMGVRRMIENRYGYDRTGKPVYPDYNDDVHCAREPFAPQKGLKIQLGADAGRSPAIILAQTLPNGRRIIFDELVGFDMGAAKIGEAFNQLIAEKYSDFEIGNAWCDPTALYKHETDEFSWVQRFAEVTGVQFQGAPTNVPSERVGAVERALKRMVDGQPAVLISPTCKVLRKGYNSGYQFMRVKLMGREVYQDVPAKNEWSHVHDANQYYMLGDGEFEATQRRKAVQGHSGTFQAQTNFNVFGR